MKMAMVVYNEAIDMELMDACERCELKNYTKLTGVFGKGNTSGTHLGNDIWPGRNNILLIAADEAKLKQLFSYIKELRDKLGHEGVKAFVWALEEAA